MLSLMGNRILTKWFLILLCLAFAQTAFPQIRFNGKVTCLENGKSLPVAFADVVLHRAADTLNAVGYAMTDLDGNFSIANLRAGKYFISINLIGYIPIREELMVSFPSTGTDFIRNFTLEADVGQLDEVTVTANASRQRLDRTEYSITKRDLSTAVHSLDLMNKIPQLTFDPASRKLASTRGNVKVLINGANASEQELMAIDADNVKKIIYYDFPPAKYSGYPAVVNVITKHAQDGFQGGADAQQAVTARFGNYGLFLKYNWGVNQLSINANSYWRDYRRIPVSETYSFSLGGSEYDRQRNGTRKFGYDDNRINIGYTRNVDGKYLLQATFSPNFQHVHLDENYNVRQLVNTALQERTGLQSEKNRQFSPVLDLYASFNLPKKHEITANLVGTYFNASNNILRNENTGNSTVFSEDMRQHNKKLSAIGTLNITKHLNGMQLSIGNKTTAEHLLSDISNNFTGGAIVPYTTKRLTSHMYAELDGQYKKFQYRASLGAEYYSSVSGSTSYTSWVFKPYILLGYVISDKLTLRAVINSYSSVPSLDAISTNTVMETENILRTGNPNLRNPRTSGAGLIVDYSGKWIRLMAGVEAYRETNPICSYFIDAGDYMLRTFENARHMNVVGMEYAIRIDPFEKKYFTLTISGQLLYERLFSDITGVTSHLNYPLTYEAALNFKNFSLVYQGSIICPTLSGVYLSTPEKKSNLILTYRYKNLTFTAMCLFFLTDADYKTYTVEHSPVQYKFRNNILDNKNMVVLGISYRFDVGKKYSEGTRTINERDTDSGLSRIQ